MVHSFIFTYSRVAMLEKLRIPREHVEALVGVILRVPALFILESWYKTDPDKLVKDTTKDMEILLIAAYYSGKCSWGRGS